MLSHMDFHLDATALEVLHKFRSHFRDMVDAGVVELRRECLLLYAVCHEVLAEEVILHVSHLAKHGEVASALDLQLVRPGLANEIFFGLHVHRVLTPVGFIGAEEWCPHHFQQTHSIVGYSGIFDILHFLLIVRLKVVQEILRPMRGGAEVEVIVEHEHERIVVLW